MARDEGMLVISNMTGGLATRPSPLIAEGASIKRMQSPNMRNVDLFNLGSVSKRLGKTLQGSAIASSVYQQQTTSTHTLSIAAASSSTLVVGIAQKITTTGAVTIQSATFKVSALLASTGTVECSIVANSGADPDPTTPLGTSQSYNLTSTGTPYTQTFNFSSPVALLATTVYWFVIKYTLGSTSDIAYLRGVNTGSVVKSNVSYPVGSWIGQTFNGYYVINSSSTSTVVNGLYDYRYGSASTQRVMAAMGGALYWNNAGTWTSLITGLGSGQDTLWSFATLKDYLFSLDNGTNQGRVWNGTASYTTKLGFRATFSPSDGGAGGIADGTYSILAVTTLISGGYRASAVGTATLAGGGSIITVGSIVMDGTSASNFGFDIAASATKWFMTAASGTVYYKIPAANMSVANPAANNTTTFNITSIANLTTANTLLDEYGLQQAYFTTQIDSPTGKYLETFQNMMAMAGDATYPSRVWFSGIADGTNLAGPQIWSTNGDLYGNYRDLEPNDGEVLVGLKEWNGNLYAFKRHSVFLIAFTGVAGNPFEVRRLSGNLGALSHWSITETPNGLAFISERGPALCSGTTISIIPAAASILNKFDLNDTASYALAAMQYTTCGNNSTKMQVQWGVSSHSATTRDITLVYDYEKQAFWENDVSANFYAEVTDANFFPAVWSGDYSAQIFRMDYGTNDNGSTIPFVFETPNISFGKMFNFKTMDHIFISGAVQSTGTLTVNIYTDMSSTVQTTRSINMADPRFVKGMMLPLNLTCTYLRIQISNSEVDVPVQINDLGFAWQDKGLRV